MNGIKLNTIIIPTEINSFVPSKLSFLELRCHSNAFGTNLSKKNLNFWQNGNLLEDGNKMVNESVGQAVGSVASATERVILATRMVDLARRKVIQAIKGLI